MGKMPWLRASDSSRHSGQAVELLFYIPPHAQAPMMIVEGAQSATAFTIPRVGSVVLVNEAWNCSLGTSNVTQVSTFPS